MIYYKAFYGSYNYGDTMRYLEPMTNREEMFKKAQEVANLTGKRVIVYSEENGKKKDFCDVLPCN